MQAVPPPPSREEVRDKLRDLLAGRASRKDVSGWAHQWVAAREPGVSDPVVWEAVANLGAADLGGEPDEYLYYESDFHAWLDEVENAIEEQE